MDFKWAIFFLCLLASCSSNNRISEAWQGRSVELLGGHPFFSKLPLEIKGRGDKELYYFREAMWNPNWSPDFPDACNHIFETKNNIIFEYRMNGLCEEKNQETLPLTQ